MNLTDGLNKWYFCHPQGRNHGRVYSISLGKRSPATAEGDRRLSSEALGSGKARTLFPMAFVKISLVCGQDRSKGKEREHHLLTRW